MESSIPIKSDHKSFADRFALWPLHLLLSDHKKDAPFLFILVRFFLIQFPFAIFLLATQHSSMMYLVLGICYLAITIFCLGPHLLMLHNICHRNPWKKKYRTQMKWLIEFIGLFYGLPPRLYYYHHIKMHHREGNAPKDLSSTEKYQRDSFLHWLHYFLSFVFTGPITIPMYFFKEKKPDYGRYVLSGYLFFYALVIGISLYHFPAAMIVFILPTLICWFGLMSGNWTQHAFLNQENPDDCYLNSISVIESLYNRRCFNDGLHIGHHLYPGMHWRDMKDEFIDNQDKYHSKNSIIFKTIDYQMIWFFLMFKRFRSLSKYVVTDPKHPKSLEQIEELLRSRMKPIVRSP